DLQLARGNVLDQRLGELHRPDQVRLEDAAPVVVVGLAERRVRPADAGIADEDVDRGAGETTTERGDVAMVGDVELQHLDVPPNRAGVVRGVRVQAGRQHLMPFRRILSNELDTEAGIAAGNNDRCHGKSYRILSERGTCAPPAAELSRQAMTKARPATPASTEGVSRARPVTGPRPRRARIISANPA